MHLVIDIGGTKTLIALFSTRGRVVQRRRFPTPQKLPDFLSTLTAALVPFAVQHPNKIINVTVAIPGIVQQNSLISFGNRPWHHPNIAIVIKNVFKVPIFFVNDANLATFYEASFYPKSGKVVFLTFSTGIGGGLAAERQILPESDDFEPGHWLYPWAGANQEAGPQSANISQSTTPSQNPLTEWEDIASCAAIGAHYGQQATSVRGRAAYADIAQRAAVGLIDVIQQQRPGVIIIGGPLAQQFPHFSRQLRQILRHNLPGVTLPRIVAARRPQESVIYGGYLYGKSQG